MSEAVVDDIVAVLPPLLQSLEALSFIARHLNPPDFGRVMEAAGTPDEALRSVRAQLAEWPAEFADVRTSIEAASEAALAAFAGLREVEHGNGDLIAVFRALRYAPRAQEALYPLVGKFPPVSDFFVDPALRDDGGLKARLEAPAADEHRRLPRRQRARQPRRLLALCARILHARSRLAAGDGAARRQRQRPQFPLELAARRAQLRRHPDRADRDRTDLGLDGRRHRHAEPDAHPRDGAQPIQCRSQPDADDGLERRRHLLLGQRTRSRLTLHASRAGRRHLPSADGGNGRRRTLARTSDLSRARPARLDVSGAGGSPDQQSAVGGRCRGDVSRDRGSQPLLSTRDERGDISSG